MGKVYIIQQPMRRNSRSGEWEPSMNLNPAAAYGDIEVLLNHQEAALTPQPMIQKLKRLLNNFCDDDFLVAVGDPTAIAAAAMVASWFNNGRVKMLRWDKRSKNYIKINLEIF